jgi:hypothetical protein
LESGRQGTYIFSSQVVHNQPAADLVWSISPTPKRGSPTGMLWYSAVVEISRLVLLKQNQTATGSMTPNGRNYLDGLEFD